MASPTPRRPRPTPNQAPAAVSTQQIQRQQFQQWAIKSATMAMTHPLELSKVLIQVGYEPIAPKSALGYFGTKPSLYLPNIFQYLQYIKSVDGFVGCYRGVIPRFYTNTIYYFVSNKLESISPIVKGYEESDGNDFDKFRRNNSKQLEVLKKEAFHPICVAESPREYMIKQTAYELLCISAGAIASQPLYVITIRTMAGFVGRETEYSTIPASIYEIFNKEGILGFFRGLVPRLIGENLQIIVSTAVVYMFRQYFKSLAKHVPLSLFSLIGNFVTSTITYQFQMLTNVMVINNSKLAIGRTPFTPNYASTFEAWKYLKLNGQLSRGSSMFNRIYNGPSVILTNGELRPTSSAYFGPLHPVGLGDLEQRVKKPALSGVPAGPPLPPISTPKTKLA